METLSLSNEIVQYLEDHSESLRIKKLLFCLCKKYWQNNLSILNKFSLEELISELIHSKSSVEQLNISLYKLVKTLNRPKIYAEVAQVIIEQLSQLYEQHSRESSPLYISNLKVEITTIDPDFVINNIVYSLTHHRESSRIKKIMFSICKNRWENNVEVVDNYAVKDLVINLCQIYPSKENLQRALKNLVKNLNKQNLYCEIANIIFKQIETLYDNFPEKFSPNKKSNTQIIHVNTSSNVSQNYIDIQPIRQQEFKTSIINFNSEFITTELKQVEEIQSQETRKSYDPFEFRLDIMQYTNPLRAKILLFSVLYHSWDRSGQDWSMLRSYSLDDLLDHLIQSGQSLADIENKLYTAAKSQSDPDSNLQTANIIIETIKSLF